MVHDGRTSRSIKLQAGLRKEVKNMITAKKDYKAFLFDLNGTLIDDMQFHIRAWHRLLNSFGKAISLQETKLECYGKNHEVLERTLPGRFTEAEKDVISVEKEKAYQQEFRPHLKLISGMDVLLEKAYSNGIKMGIGSAAIRFNIDFVTKGLNLEHYFTSIVSADDVGKSKPDPETFLKGAAALGIDPAGCLVFEDSPKGTEAAYRAGMDALVITTMHVPAEFDPVNVIGFVNNYPPDLFEQLIPVR